MSIGQYKEEEREDEDQYQDEDHEELLLELVEGRLLCLRGVAMVLLLELDHLDYVNPEE
jgi:hypothetical protein